MKAIITFHSVDNNGSVLSYPVNSFALLLKRLRDLEMPVLSLHDLLDVNVRKGVAITFDDGMQSVFKSALPVLKEYKAPAHVFVTTNAVNSDKMWPYDNRYGEFDMLDWDEIGALSDAGIYIDAHTQSHPDMRTITPDQLEDECHSADEIIEGYVGKKPEYFAYPFGYHNKRVRAYTGEHYSASVTTELRMLGDNEDSSALPRLDSFYFQSDNAINNLFNWKFNQYIKTRWLLRRIKGSQCNPACQ